MILETSFIYLQGDVSGNLPSLMPSVDERHPLMAEPQTSPQGFNGSSLGDESARALACVP